ncbi:MAG: hypothetical protein MI924_28920 [Chloroflexales bacterium]|nr:hypothetical protein [Chloroflexales bacterium]
MWIIAVIIALMLSATGAKATHHNHNTDQLHIHNIHFSELDGPVTNEDFCTDVVDGDGITEEELRDRVADALLFQPDRWDQTGYVGSGTYCVDFFQGAYTCLDPVYGDRSSLEVQYRSYATSPSAKPCGDGYSCVQFFNAVASVHDHNDYLNSVVWLEEDHVALYDQYTRRQLISHETGHVLGFRDPVHGVCTNGPTIMNIPYYGCDDPGSGPTSHDKDVLVNDVIPNKHPNP